MSKVDFHIIESDCVHLIPKEAVSLLEKSTKRTPAPLLGVNDILWRARNSIGSIVIAEMDNKICGVFFLMVAQGIYGKALNIVSFSAENPDEWHEEGKSFLIEQMNANECQNIVAITRKGISRRFPWMREVGSVCEYRIEH